MANHGGQPWQDLEREAEESRFGRKGHRQQWLNDGREKITGRDARSSLTKVALVCVCVRERERVCVKNLEKMWGS